MTVSSNLNKHIYSGNGVVTEWGFTFSIIETTDIRVFLTSPGGTTTEIFTNFAVDADAAIVTYPTVVSELPALPVDWKITLLRYPPATQEVDLKNQGAFNAETLEAALDKLTMLYHTVFEMLSRAILSDVTASSNPILPALIAGYLYCDGVNFSFTVPTATNYNGTISAGLDAAKPVSPSIRDMYVASDTQIIYICHVAGTWTAPLVSGSLLYGLGNILVSAGVIPAANLPSIDGAKLTGLGNIGAGAGVIPSANLPTDNVKLTGNQTVDDVKTFQHAPVMSAGIDNQNQQITGLLIENRTNDTGCTQTGRLWFRTDV